MWREDDFEDKGKRVKVATEDKVRELSNEPDRKPEGKAERYDERELSH